MVSRQVDCTMYAIRLFLLLMICMCCAWAYVDSTELGCYWLGGTRRLTPLDGAGRVVSLRNSLEYAD